MLLLATVVEFELRDYEFKAFHSMPYLLMSRMRHDVRMLKTLIARKSQSSDWHHQDRSNAVPPVLTIGVSAAAVTTASRAYR